MRARPASLLTAASLALLALSAFLTHAALFKQNVQGNSNFTRLIPPMVGEWQLIDEYPASPSEIQGLETSDIIKRAYANNGKQVELVVAYIAHSNRKSAHAQEACLRGAGAMVGSVEMVRLKTIPVQAKVLTIDLRDRRQWVYYWYKMGSLHTAEYLLSSLRMFLNGLFSKEPQGTTLVRIMTPEGRGEDAESVSLRMEDFARNLVPLLEMHLP